MPPLFVSCKTQLFVSGRYYVNSLPNNKILDCSKLKVFADDKMKLAKMMIFVLDRVENIVGKGENTGYHHFLLSLKCFQKSFWEVMVNSYLPNYNDE